MAWLGPQEVSDLGAHREKENTQWREQSPDSQLGHTIGSLEKFTEERSSWRSFLFLI